MLPFAELPLVKPSDEIISGAYIPEYQNTWIMTEEIDQIETFKGIWLDQIQYDTLEEEAILKRTADITFCDGAHQFHSDWVYQRNLLPIKTEIKDISSDSILMRAEYKQNSISGFKGFSIEDTSREERIKAKYSFQLDEPIYDWHLWGIIVVGFPLQLHYKAKFLAHASTGYSYSPFIWVGFEVVDKVILDAGAWGQVECWLVDLYGEVPWKLWLSIEKKYPPVLQLRVQTTSEIIHWWKCKDSSE